ncbi:hypothetical protein MBLNU13_g11655t1 [Cladosporium sp. NU13]
MYADCLPGASVTVRVSGLPLIEHATEHSDMSATTFVEAVAGAEFDVALKLNQHFAYSNPANEIQFSVYVDGAFVQSFLLRHNDNKCVIHGPEETRKGVTTIKHLTFAQHASTDHSVNDSTIKKLGDLGQIKVTLHRCREAGPCPTTQRDSKFEGIVDDAVPEKALKGRSVSSHTKLGRVEKRANPNSSLLKVTYPFGKDPIATYVFQYRDLEIEGIIERAPSPVPLVDRDPHGLTPDELREQNRLLHGKRASVKIKKEVKPEKRARQRSTTLSNEDDDGGDVTFVSETNKRRRTRESMENAEVIDLSDD